MVLGQNIGDHVDKVKIFNIPKINPYVKGLSSTPKSHSQKSLRSIITPPPPPTHRGLYLILGIILILKLNQTHSN